MTTKEKDVKQDQCSLPFLPSDLIRVAVSDLERCEVDPRYKVDMSVWHSPRRFLGMTLGCTVCFAGAVMSKTCELPLSVDAGTFPDAAGRENYAKFQALDDFRVGGVRVGLRRMGFELPPDFEGQRSITSYGRDRRAFKKQMTDLAADLYRAGL